ncbi:unnamed protein product [Protopolystoma xenopodis]|uniref:Uncharacterized protein n=1 Tax=Protopolystoma xenopodis TaxID=117903 RepID=A0A448X7M3_9PLAT|nr:unnamed protein product [Protopolystoma xenopodis]
MVTRALSLDSSIHPKLSLASDVTVGIRLESRLNVTPVPHSFPLRYNVTPLSMSKPRILTRYVPGSESRRYLRNHIVRTSKAGQSEPPDPSCRSELCSCSEPAFELSDPSPSQDTLKNDKAKAANAHLNLLCRRFITSRLQRLQKRKPSGLPKTRRRAFPGSLDITADKTNIKPVLAVPTSLILDREPTATWRGLHFSTSDSFHSYALSTSASIPGFQCYSSDSPHILGLRPFRTKSEASLNFIDLRGSPFCG